MTLDKTLRIPNASALLATSAMQTAVQSVIQPGQQLGQPGLNSEVATQASPIHFDKTFLNSSDSYDYTSETSGLRQKSSLGSSKSDDDFASKNVDVPSWVPVKLGKSGKNTSVKLIAQADANGERGMYAFKDENTKRAVAWGSRNRDEPQRPNTAYPGSGVCLYGCGSPLPQYPAQMPSAYPAGYPGAQGAYPTGYPGAQAAYPAGYPAAYPAFPGSYPAPPAPYYPAPAAPAYPAPAAPTSVPAAPVAAPVQAPQPEPSYAPAAPAPPAVYPATPAYPPMAYPPHPVHMPQMSYTPAPYMGHPQMGLPHLSMQSMGASQACYPAPLPSYGAQPGAAARPTFDGLKKAQDYFVFMEKKRKSAPASSTKSQVPAAPIETLPSDRSSGHPDPYYPYSYYGSDTAYSYDY